MAISGSQSLELEELEAWILSGLQALVIRVYGLRVGST